MKHVEPAEIAALLHPYATPTEKLISDISIYIDILLKWNSKISLTSIRDPRQMVSRHFGESLFLAEKLIHPEWRGEVIDVGSGAGFPGLPIAMYCSSADVTLLEAHGKKVTFLNEVVYALKLKNARVFHGRAEQFSSPADLVTLRAVEDFDKVLPIALGLVKPGGRLALMVGRTQMDKAKLLPSKVEWNQPIYVPGGESRVLAVGTKIVNVG